jgi:hypothetical protein
MRAGVLNRVACLCDHCGPHGSSKPFRSPHHGWCVIAKFLFSFYFLLKQLMGVIHSCNMSSFMCLSMVALSSFDPSLVEA